MTPAQSELKRIGDVLIEQGASMVFAFNAANKSLADAQAIGAAAKSPELKASAQAAEWAARDARWAAIEAAYTTLSVNLQALLAVMSTVAQSQELLDASAKQALLDAVITTDLSTPIHDALEEELKGQQSKIAQAGKAAVEAARQA